MPSRRTQIEMTDAELHAFLAEQLVMQFATVGPRGLPHMVPLWFVADGTTLRGWTYAKSQKTKNLERDARATIGIEDGVQYHELRGGMLECAVELEREPERVQEFGRALFGRYAGEITPELDDMIAAQAQKRGGLTFRPKRTARWGHRRVGGRL